MSTHPILMSAVQYDAPLKAGTLATTDLAGIAAELGLDGVEYREVYWRDKAQELPLVREQLAQHGLQAAYCTFTPLFSADAGARAQLLTDIDDAAALGSPFLRVFIGVNDMPPTPDDGPAWRGARAAIDRAGQQGLRLALENHINVLGPRLDQVRGALETLASPVMGTNIDTGNYVQNGEPLLEAIAVLRPWIIYAHLKDVQQVDGALTVVPIGQGTLDYAAIVAAFAAVGRPFPLGFEFGGGDDPAAALQSSLAVVRGHLAAVG
jgi:sugar phosphate isomerase/epimerase